MQLCALIPSCEHYVLERRDVVEHIQDKFASISQNTGKKQDFISSVVLEGDPGTGKSQLARQFGEHYFNEHVATGRSVVVYTLHAGSLEELYHSYLEFADCLGIEKMESIHNAAQSDSYQNKLDILVIIVGEILRKHRDWLVIVENVMNWTDSKEGKEIFEYIPHSSNMRTNYWGRGKALITMQLQGKFRDSTYLRVVDKKKLELSPQHAIQLLVEVEKEGTNDCMKQLDVEYLQDVKEVAEKLEGIPLALVSAAVYKRMKTKDNPNYNWKKYIREFDRAMKYRLRTTQYAQNCLSTAVVKTLQKLGDSMIFRLAFIALAFCECKNIPEALIKDYIKSRRGSSLADDVEMQKLVKCPLLFTTKATKDTNDRRVCLYHMHRVTHSTLRNDVLSKWESLAPPTQESYLLPLLQVILAYQKDLHARSDYWMMGYLASHLFAVGNAGVTKYNENDTECQWSEIPEVLFVAVQSCRMSPRGTQEQMKCMEQCFSLSQQMDTVPRTSEAKYLSCWASLIATSGDDKEGRKKGYQALEMMCMEDPEPELFAYALITLSWYLRPDYDKGIATIKRNLETVERGCGYQSKEYALLLFQLGDLVKKYDRLEAREYFEQSLAIFKHLGEQHKLHYTIACSYYCRFLLKSWSSADIKEAVSISENCLKITEEVLNQNTMDYINRCSTFGRALLSVFQPRRAISVLTPLIEKVQLYQRPEAQWRIQQPLWIANMLIGEMDLALFYLRDNVRLANDYSFDVSTLDRYVTAFFAKAVPIVNCLVVKPLKWLRFL